MRRLSNKRVEPERTPAFRLLLDPAEDTPEQQSAGVTALALRNSRASDDKEFLAAFRRAVHLEPNDPDYHYILGDALSRLERHREALPALREAVLMSPSDAAYHYALGVVLWNLRCGSRACGTNSPSKLGEGTPLWRAAFAVLSPLGRGFRRLRPRRRAPGTFLSYLGLAAVVYSVWLYAPPYVHYFILKDRLAEIAGAPLRG